MFDIYHTEQYKMEDLFTKENKYAFLIGAGVSMNFPSNMPSAIDIIKCIFDQYLPSETMDQLLNHPKMRFELIIEIFQNLFDKNLKILNFMEVNIQPNLIHYLLAKFISQQNVVVTTNFDYFLEEALTRIEIDVNNIIPIITKEDFIQYSDFDTIIKQELKPLVKIHGSKINYISKLETFDSVITKISDYGRGKNALATFELEPYKFNLLNNWFSNRSLIVMGYSAGDDFDIVPMLEQYKKFNRIIWINHSPESKFVIRKLKEKIFKTKASLNDMENFQKILYQLRKSNPNVEIFRIDVDTVRFSKYLQDMWFPDFEIPQNNVDIGSSNERFHFSSWFNSNFKPPEDIDKFLFAAHIFEKLSLPEDANHFINLALNLAKNEKSSKKIVESNIFLGKLNITFKNYRRSTKALQNVLNFVEAGDYSWHRAMALERMAYIYIMKSERSKENFRYSKDVKDAFHEAKELLSVAGRIAKFNQYEDINLNILIDWCLLYIQQREYSIFTFNPFRWKSKQLTGEALSTIYQALELANKIGDLQKKAMILSFLTHIYTYQAKWKYGIIACEQALQIAQEIGDIEIQINATTQLAYLYAYRLFLIPSTTYLRKAKSLSKKYKFVDSDYREMTETANSNLKGGLFSIFSFLNFGIALVIVLSIINDTFFNFGLWAVVVALGFNTILIAPYLWYNTKYFQKFKNKSSNYLPGVSLPPSAFLGTKFEN
ncbi:MAG: SIR2 family protein [Promethearchaeota archaeon]